MREEEGVRHLSIGNGIDFACSAEKWHRGDIDDRRVMLTDDDIDQRMSREISGVSSIGDMYISVVTLYVVGMNTGALLCMNLLTSI